MSISRCILCCQRIAGNICVAFCNCICSCWNFLSYYAVSILDLLSGNGLGTIRAIVFRTGDRKYCTVREVCKSKITVLAKRLRDLKVAFISLIGDVVSANFISEIACNVFLCSVFLQCIYSYFFYPVSDFSNTISQVFRQVLKLVLCSSVFRYGHFCLLCNLFNDLSRFIYCLANQVYNNRCHAKIFVAVISKSLSSFYLGSYRSISIFEGDSIVRRNSCSKLLCRTVVSNSYCYSFCCCRIIHDTFNRGDIWCSRLSDSVSIGSRNLICYGTKHHISSGWIRICV